MVRRVLSDSIWEQLQVTMKTKGCHRCKNDRDIMEAILWKLRTGAPWRDLPIAFCPWKTAYNRFNRWAKKGLWEKFFLSYEAKLIRNGYSPTEVMYALTSMRVELGMAKSELWANLFARLKHFRGIATPFDKLARNYKAILFIACTFIWLKLK